PREQTQTRRLARPHVPVGQTAAVVLAGVPRDSDRRVDRLAVRGGREVGAAGVAAARLRALAPVHRHTQAAVAVVLDRIGLALAYRDRQAVAFGNVTVAAGGAGAQRLI